MRVSRATASPPRTAPTAHLLLHYIWVGPAVSCHPERPVPSAVEGSGGPAFFVFVKGGAKSRPVMAGYRSNSCGCKGKTLCKSPLFIARKNCSTLGPVVGRGLDGGAVFQVKPQMPGCEDNGGGDRHGNKTGDGGTRNHASSVKIDEREGKG